MPPGGIFASEPGCVCCSGDRGSSNAHGSSAVSTGTPRTRRAGMRPRARPPLQVVGGPRVLGRHGFDVHMVSSAHLAELPPGPRGRMHRQMRGRNCSARWVRTASSSTTHRPSGPSSWSWRARPSGSRSTCPLGGDALPRTICALTSGPASLAFRTKAKVLPVITERHGTRLDLRMLEPLDPADHRDVRSLRAAIARTCRPLIVAKPEMVEIAWYPSPLVTEALTSQAPDEGYDLARSARRPEPAGPGCP